ncbi:hypothetical protein [Pseudomonas congelans]|uniref:hypothetical protein n=1 Tax=Pseudomonas congelans TaxID=200452 RepID=UPI001864F241|nr:hypothetical protein [Pseudomonas congelans]
MNLLSRARPDRAPKTARAASNLASLGLLIVACTFQLPALAAGVPANTVSAPASQSGASSRRADFRNTEVSPQARDTANWVVDSGDNQGMPFIIIDKMQARVLVFDALGRLGGSASALLGLAVGDDSVPGIGQRKLSSILPHERTTPAGRFVASLAPNLKGEEILWVDYQNAIAMHPVVTSNPKEHRAERLASSRLQDKRISYGCINIPADFYLSHVSPAFSGTNGVVYVLPETRSNASVFTSYYQVK